MNVSLFLEIKEEYTEHLIDAMVPFLCEGLNTMYKEAEKIAIEANVADDKTLIIFQKLLQTIDRWGQEEINRETHRIKDRSGTGEYLDDLVKAVIKTNIILLTYSNTVSNAIGQSYYNALTTAAFIHKCYIECAKEAHNNPHLYLQRNISPTEIKRNQVLIQQNIRVAVSRAIRKILPIAIMIKEYLANTINIIGEAPNVELMGANLAEQPVNAMAMPTAPLPFVKAESIMDPKIEEEVMKIIKTDAMKSEKEKIKDLMKMDKLISSMPPPKPKNQEGGRRVATDSESISASLGNRGMNPSDKKIINVRFSASEASKSASRTSISSQIFGSGEESERVDPDNAAYIEEYGELSLKASVKKDKRHR